MVLGHKIWVKKISKKKKFGFYFQRHNLGLKNLADLNFVNKLSWI